MQVSAVPNVRSGLDPEPTPTVSSGLDAEVESPPSGAPAVSSGVWFDAAEVESLTRAEGQFFLDEAYDSLGLDFGVRPRFDPQLDSAARITRDGVVLGRAAFSSEAKLRTTLIEQGVRLQQWAEGRLGTSGAHRIASELEARLRQLDTENVKRAGLTPELEAELVEDVRSKIDALFRLQADGAVYDVLVRGKARPPEAFVATDPPAWIRHTP
jgi:hypothetical protein